MPAITRIPKRKETRRGLEIIIKKKVVEYKTCEEEAPPPRRKPVIDSAT